MSGDVGASAADLARLTGLDTASISRRYDAARRRLAADRKLAYAKDQVKRLYLLKIAESHT